MFRWIRYANVVVLNKISFILKAGSDLFVFVGNCIVQINSLESLDSRILFLKCPMRIETNCTWDHGTHLIEISQNFHGARANLKPPPSRRRHNPEPPIFRITTSNIPSLLNLSVLCLSVRPVCLLRESAHSHTCICVRLCWCALLCKYLSDLNFPLPPSFRKREGEREQVTGSNPGVCAVSHLTGSAPASVWLALLCPEPFPGNGSLNNLIPGPAK